jgi:hypothetical protein
MANQRGVDHADLVRRKTIEPGTFPFGFAQEASKPGKRFLGHAVRCREQTENNEEDVFHGVAIEANAVESLWSGERRV